MWGKFFPILVTEILSCCPLLDTTSIPVVLYGNQTRCFTLSEEHRLRLCENRELRKMYRCNRQEVTGSDLLISFIMQCLSILGIFTFHRQQLVSTSDMPMQFLRVTRRVPSKDTFHQESSRTLRLLLKAMPVLFPQYIFVQIVFGNCDSALFMLKHKMAGLVRGEGQPAWFTNYSQSQN